MGHFRDQGSVDLVSAHVKRDHGFVRSARVLHKGGQIVQSRDGDEMAKKITTYGGGRLVGAKGRQLGRRLEEAGEVARAEDGGEAVGIVTRKAAWAAGRSVGYRGGRAVLNVLGRGVRGVRERAEYASASYAGSGSRPVVMRAGRYRSSGFGQRVRRRPVSTPTRQKARGARRVGDVAVRVVRGVATNIATAVAGMAGAIGGPAVLVVSALLALVLVVMSFLPSWLVNIIAGEQSGNVSFMVGDDYPWAADVRLGDGKPSDVYNTPNPFTGYYFGNCTDFVYWRVNRDMGGSLGAWVYTRQNLTPLGGNGRQWGKEGNLPGWETITNPHKAQPGDIVSFESGVLGHTSEFGHVAYVASVENGNITTENYGVAQYYVETISKADAVREIGAGRLVIKRNPALKDRVNGGFGSSNDVVKYAMSQVGMKYGRGRGHGSVDCCWLVHNAYKHARGISLPLSVPGNPPATAKCEYAMYSQGHTFGGTLVPLSKAQPGDIVFMQQKGVSKRQDNLTHVGIFAGGGKIIDAIPAGGVGVRDLSAYRYTEDIEPMVMRVAP